MLCIPSAVCLLFLFFVVFVRDDIFLYIIIQYAGPPECNFKTTWRCMIECRRFIISCNNENMLHLYVLSINTKSLLIKISLLPQHSISSRGVLLRYYLFELLLIILFIYIGWCTCNNNNNNCCCCCCCWWKKYYYEWSKHETYKHDR